MEFQLGSAVVLNGQNQVMTVKNLGAANGVGHTIISCVWHDRDGKPQEASFPHVVLKSLDKPAMEVSNELRAAKVAKASAEAEAAKAGKAQNS